MKCTTNTLNKTSGTMPLQSDMFELSDENNLDFQIQMKILRFGMKLLVKILSLRIAH